jgi:hypothetical protein
MNNLSARKLFDNTQVEEKIQLLFQQKWKEVELFSDKCKKCCQNYDNGGILIIKCVGDKKPMMCFIENNMESKEWMVLVKDLPNFHEAYIDYDPTKHYFIYLAVQEDENDRGNGQLVRLNY